MKDRKSAKFIKNSKCLIEPKFRKKSSYMIFSALLMIGMDSTQAKTCSSNSVSNNDPGRLPVACTNDSAGEDITSPQGTTLTASGSKPTTEGNPTAAALAVFSDHGNAGIITNAGDINGTAYARGIEVYQGQSAQDIINTGNINVAGHAIELGYQKSPQDRDGHLTGVENATLPDGSTYKSKLAIYNSGNINATGAKGNTDGANWGDESAIRLAGFEPKDGKVYSTIAGDIFNDSNGQITGYGINLGNSTPVINGNIINKGTIQGTNGSGIRDQKPGQD